MDYVRILVNWVVCGHWCQLLNEYFQQTKSVDLSELRCVDISELCYLWSLVGFSIYICITYSYVHMKPLLSMFMKGNEVYMTGQNLT